MSHHIDMEDHPDPEPVLLSKHAKNLLRFLNLLPARMASHDNTRLVHPHIILSIRLPYISSFPQEHHCILRRLRPGCTELPAPGAATNEAGHH